MLGPPSLRITVSGANPLLARVSRAKSLGHSAQSRRASGGKGETGNILESWDMDLRWIKHKQLAVSTALENTTRLTHWYPLMLVSCIDFRAIHWCKLDTTTYQNTQIIKRTIQMHRNKCAENRWKRRVISVVSNVSNASKPKEHQRTTCDSCNPKCISIWQCVKTLYPCSWTTAYRRPWVLGGFGGGLITFLAARLTR